MEANCSAIGNELLVVLLDDILLPMYASPASVTTTLALLTLLLDEEEAVEEEASCPPSEEEDLTSSGERCRIESISCCKEASSVDRHSLYASSEEKSSLQVGNGAFIDIRLMHCLRSTRAF